MSTATWNDFGKITFRDEIWSWEIQILISIFFRNCERYSHKIFINDRCLNCGVWLGVEQVGCHFRSSQEVKKEIEIFKDNLSNQNICHIIRSVFNCPKPLSPPVVEASTLVMLKKSFKFSIFNAYNILYYYSVSLEINICCKH
jgi:hypothetical protein